MCSYGQFCRVTLQCFATDITLANSTATMKRGTCHLCSDDKELCASHALPNSAFRFLFKQGSGKAVMFVDDETTKIAYSSESWDEYLLCKDCEDYLNLQYDQYGISVLKGSACTVNRGTHGVTFAGVNKQRLRMFVLSVVWRMAISPNRAYGNVELPYELEMEIRAALREHRNVRPALAEVGLCRLKESSGIKALSEENLQRMLVAPFTRDFIAFRSTCFLLFGFVIEAFFPRPPKKITRGVGMCSGPSSVILLPFQEVAAFPELLKLLVGALDKHEQGLSRVG